MFFSYESGMRLRCYVWLDWGGSVGLKSNNRVSRFWRGKVSNLWSRASTVYHIWLQRNESMFNGLIKLEESIIQAIKWDVKSRLGCCRRFKDSTEQNPLQSQGYPLLSVNWWKELLVQGSRVLVQSLLIYL